MNLIYIAGPYWHPDPAQRWRNANNFRLVQRILLDEVNGSRMFAYINPIANSMPAADLADEWYWRRAGIALARHSDAVIFLPGWRESQGCIAEFNEAVQFKIPYAELAFIDAKSVRIALTEIYQALK